MQNDECGIAVFPADIILLIVHIGLTQQTGKLGFIVPSERWHSQNAGENGLPHQPEGWFAMTSFFVFSLFYRSVTLQRYVIANQCAHWCGNPFLAMRSIASAVGRSRQVQKFLFVGQLSKTDKHFINSAFSILHSAFIPRSRVQSSYPVCQNPRPAGL